MASRSPAKRKIVVAGRRGGKTTWATYEAIMAAMQGKRVLEAAPTSDQTDAFWEKAKAYLKNAIQSGDVYKNETNRIIEFPTGGRIRTKTAWDADSLRGDYADLLILDEYSLMKPSAWYEVGAPMLLDNGGDAIFIFTPQRKNHAYQMFMRGKGDHSGRWHSFHFTSYDNPYLSKEAMGEISEDMPRESYIQEILAEFLENEGAVFRGLGEVITNHIESPGEHNNHRIVMGIDWGRDRDFTAISVGCSDCQREVEVSRFGRVSYELQKERVQEIVKRWNPTSILGEENSIGAPVLDSLRAQGMSIRGFTTSVKTKPPLIENLILVVEEKLWRFVIDPIWSAEMEAYERRTSANTARPIYNAPEGVHDDTVMARALMVWQGHRARRPMIQVA